ncbi:hypothetical protein MSMEG_4677 [Mycolicibacterium smegmatis MC2 155]|uniref:Uncharacterized protein n=1 Tax=Mycolicibacterium smegmatis (strain ATCC 700084 / mc(2)155) TaxID=246196 RepID=A0R1A1_MYCS2|nr:hypothetical protein MSMEG_4677 [Mycolicibacterium smegmatis MC2 155]
MLPLVAGLAGIWLVHRAPGTSPLHVSLRSSVVLWSARIVPWNVTLHVTVSPAAVGFTMR